MKKTRQLLISLLTLLCCSTGAWALNQDGEGNYLIGSVQDWTDFAIGINDGSIEGSANAKMTADIDLGDDQTMIGTLEHPYQGVFDGQGHTLTVNYDMYLSTNAVAPFDVVGDAIIQRLHVDGSIKQQLCAAGGVAGTIMGNLTVRECWVSAYMYVQGSGWLQGTIGGIASYCDDPNVTNCEIRIEDCLFDGELGTGYHCGSIMSHVNGDYGNHATLRNCLNMGTFPGASGSTGTFIRPIQGENFDIVNCFYKNSFGYVQGTQATDEQLADGTITTALQNGREEDVWAQDPVTNQPMLKIFATKQEPREPTVTQEKLFATRLADMNTARICHQIMPTDDGFVVFGGHTTSFVRTQTAERYSIATDSWMQMDMLYCQDYAAGIVTADGKMLLAGGMSGNSGTGASSLCELYDPADNTFTATGSMVQARSMATATMTKSGKIYVNGCWYNSSYGLECYDPETGTFSKVGEGLNVYHPLLLSLRNERVAIIDGSRMVVVEDDVTSDVTSELLTEYPILKGWDETQMKYYQARDYSYIVVGKSATQAVLLSIYDDAAEGVKIAKITDLPMTLPADESKQIGYYGEGTRVFCNNAKHKVYVQTILKDDGFSPVIIEYTYPIVSSPESGNIVVYATDKPLAKHVDNAAWTMLADGTLVSAGGGDSNFAPHKQSYIYYLGDGSDDPDGIEEIQNSKFKIQNEGAVHNLAGQRLTKPQRGINIINGKKIVTP